MKIFVVLALIVSAYAVPHHAPAGPTGGGVQNFLVRVEQSVLDSVGGQAAAPPP